MRPRNIQFDYFAEIVFGLSITAPFFSLNSEIARRNLQLERCITFRATNQNVRWIYLFLYHFKPNFQNLYFCLTRNVFYRST